MTSGRIADSFNPAMVRAFSRASTSAGNCGATSTERMSASAGSRLSSTDSVRRCNEARSMSALPESAAPTSARRLAISRSSRSEAPRSIIPLVSAATPDLPPGSRTLPAAKSICTSSIGRSWFSTKKTRAPDGASQCSIFGVAPAQRESSPTPITSARRTWRSLIGRPP